MGEPAQLDFLDAFEVTLYIYTPPNGQPSTLHLGTCSHCNHGKGQVPYQKGKGLQPGWERTRIANLLATVNRPRICGVCRHHLRLMGL